MVGADLMTCDWGDCGEPAEGFRQWRPIGGWHAPIWVPVCRDHDPAELVLAV